MFTKAKLIVKCYKCGTKRVSKVSLWDELGLYGHYIPDGDNEPDFLELPDAQREVVFEHIPIEYEIQTYQSDLERNSVQYAEHCSAGRNNYHYHRITIPTHGPEL